MKDTKFTISGPAVEQTKPGYGPALSFATTCASHAAKARLAVTFYVRNSTGDTCGRAEAHEDGTASIFGAAHYA